MRRLIAVAVAVATLAVFPVAAQAAGPRYCGRACPTVTTPFSNLWASVHRIYSH